MSLVGARLMAKRGAVEDHGLTEKEKEGEGKENSQWREQRACALGEDRRSAATDLTSHEY